MVHLPRSGGVVARDTAARSRLQHRRIRYPLCPSPLPLESVGCPPCVGLLLASPLACGREYFYGATLPPSPLLTEEAEQAQANPQAMPPLQALTPCLVHIDMNRCKVWLFRGKGVANSGLLPGAPTTMPFPPPAPLLSSSPP